MAQYTIKVLNSSGYDKSYVVFMAPPKVTGSVGQPSVFTNAWVTFHGVSPGSTDTITYTDLTYAYWATAAMPIVPGTTMGQSGVMPVNTMQQDSVQFHSSPQSIGFNATTHGGAMSGSFRIIAGKDFNRSNGYLFGLARPGNIPGVPSPVATFVAEPNDTFNITPVIKFYVADGAFVPGSVINVSAFSTDLGAIDFTGKAQTNVVVTQGPDGGFTPHYY